MQKFTADEGMGDFEVWSIHTFFKSLIYAGADLKTEIRRYSRIEVYITEFSTAL